MYLEKVGMGGGCHWCTEAIFQTLKGVQSVEQGWISSTLVNANTLSEAVIVHFDPTIVSLDDIIEIHLHTHNATSRHSLREKYRSAVYTFSLIQENEVQNILEKKQKLFTKPLITKAYPFGKFVLNDEKYLNYYKNNPEKPFCKVHIEPKLKTILKKLRKE